MKIAAAQAGSGGVSQTVNAAMHVEAIEAAKARVVVFPELSLCGYDFDAAGTDVSAAAVQLLIDACARTDTVALVGAIEEAQEGRFIAVLAVDGRSARFIYRKSFLSPEESARFDAGDTGGARLDVDGWKIGLGICKDTRIAEHHQAVFGSAGGNPQAVDLYVAGLVHATDEVDELAERAQTIAAFATVPVALANAAGYDIAGIGLAGGHSGIWGADGRQLAEAGANAADVITATLKPLSANRA